MKQISSTADMSRLDRDMLIEGWLRELPGHSFYEKDLKNWQKEGMIPTFKYLNNKQTEKVLTVLCLVPEDTFGPGPRGQVQDL